MVVVKIMHVRTKERSADHADGQDVISGLDCQFPLLPRASTSQGGKEETMEVTPPVKICSSAVGNDDAACDDIE